MAWIFQGNPKDFDIDDYLARYPELVYWRAPRYRQNITVGDRVFIWRARSDSGVIASGTIVELPTEASNVRYPEALGDDLWLREPPDANEPKVGISLDSIRLSAAEGMLPRAAIKEDDLLRSSTIIRMSNATVFRLSEEESKRFNELWGNSYQPESETFDTAAFAGKLQLRSHRRRERSRFLVKKKLEDFRRLHGSLFCEVCALNEDSRYPENLAASVFEVHHTSPLSNTTAPRRTTLADLAVVCANCHRAIHASADVESNMVSIRQRFESTSVVKSDSVRTVCPAGDS